jgi:hypothetical protein
MKERESILEYLLEEDCDIVLVWKNGNRFLYFRISNATKSLPPVSIFIPKSHKRLKFTKRLLKNSQEDILTNEEYFDLVFESENKMKRWVKLGDRIDVRKLKEHEQNY